ncbi:MAG: MFS transporter [Clostridia bacterium]|nr:MFS transporter [Clostridia bacterium]
MTSQTPAVSKDFILMAVGQIISLFGNQILRFALPLYLLNQTGSSALFGTISAISYIPMILLFPVGGMIADRVNKRNIMVILDFSTSALVFLFSVTVSGQNIVPLIAATMFILYAIQGAYQPAVQASIPALVSNEHMIQANSIVNMISSLANMLGPVLGGLLFASIGLSPILYISVACFFASAVMEIFIHIPFQKQKAERNILIIGFQDIRESFQFLIRKKPILLKIAVSYGMISLLLCSLFNIALPVLFTQELGFTPSVANRLYGYSQGAIAIGSILGGLFAGLLSKRLHAHTIPYYILSSALCILICGIALNALHSSMAIFIILTLACSVLMILTTLFQIQMMSYVQILTPNELIGKVISCIICICMCSNPIGQFIYGFVFEHIGKYSYIPFYISAMLVIVIGLLCRKLFETVEDR